MPRIASLTLWFSPLLLCACRLDSGPPGGGGGGTSAPGGNAAAASAAPARPLLYPRARRGDVVDDYHGTKVADPYHWLEDPDSPETRAWIEAENRLSRPWLDSIPQRAAIRARLEALWFHDRYGVPFREGKRYFFTRQRGRQNQAVLYTADTPRGEGRLLLDPNLLSEDGTVAVADTTVSRDGSLLAYSLSSGGSDWREIRVREVESGRDLADVLRWVKFSSPSWSHDGSGFYYSRYDEPDEKTALREANYYQKLYFHRLGTSQAEDRLVYQRRDHKEWGFDGEVSEDGRWLVISVWWGTAPENGVFYRDLSRDGPVVELLSDFDAAYRFAGNDGPVFYFRTDRDAPRGRLIAIDVTRPDPASRREIIPQSAATLRSVAAIGGRFVAHYLEDASSRLRVFSREGKLEEEVRLPAIGSLRGMSGHDDSPELFYGFTSFTFPTSTYRRVLGSGESELVRAPKLDFRPGEFVVRQVFYTSRDGTRVPMFLAHRRGLELDGERPTYLYGYGGFDIALTPRFSVPDLVWLERGGVYAQPSLRGGGEYGEEWHQAGTRERKQNVFDDFIAAAEWLIAHGYTSRRRLAIGGRSNGGLLVGACLTQRPDLFAAALPGVGVLDMLRFHRFTIGWAWISDYGSADNPDDFEYLRAYSPLHNVRPGTSYPATLVSTADHDDRVVPAHSFKFTAALQAAQAGPAPILIRIDTRAGHGAGKPVSKKIEEWADNWAFLTRVLRVKKPTPKEAIAP